MASIQGISLTATRTFDGLEYEGFIGNVCQGRRRLGVYIQPGDGGEGRFEPESKGAERALMSAMLRHYEENPSVDAAKCHHLAADEFVRLRDGNALMGKAGYAPKEDDGFVLDIFMEELNRLRGAEAAWKNGVRKGFGCLVTAEFFPSEENHAVPLDLWWNCRNPKAAIKECRQAATNKSRTHILTVYSSAADFDRK